MTPESIVVVVMMVMFLSLPILFRLKWPDSEFRPELRDCLSAILKEDLTTTLIKNTDEILAANKRFAQPIYAQPIAEFINSLCCVFYWLNKKGDEIFEQIDMNIDDFMGVGHGSIKILWLNGNVSGWYHNTTLLPEMSVGDNFNAYQILETIRNEYRKALLAN